MLNSMRTNKLKKNQINLLGHRGTRGEIFENSRQSFEHLHRLAQHSQGSIIGVEFDVQLTCDNQLVVFHDDTLARLYNLQSRVDQLSLTELQYRCDGDYHMLPLEELTVLIDSYQHIELEIKTNPQTNHVKLIQALTYTLQHPNFNNLPITLTSFDLKLLHLIKFHPHLSKLRTGLLVERNLTSIEQNNPQFDSKQLCRDVFALISTTLATGCCHIGLHHSLYNQNILALCQQYHISTSAWTVNKPSDAMRLINLGVDNIITDYPSAMLSSLPKP